MNADTAPKVQVENQLIRFTHEVPVDQEKAVKTLSGKRSGEFVLVQLDVPRAMIIIDQIGRIIVHGTKRIQIARAAAKEILLRMGRSDDGLSSETGTLQASFKFPQELTFDGIEDALYPTEVSRDVRLDCVRINDTRHGIELLIWPNGKAVALGATHANLVAMSAVHWGAKLKSANLFIAASSGE